MQISASPVQPKKIVTVLRLVTHTSKQVFVVPKALQSFNQPSGKSYVV